MKCGITIPSIAAFDIESLKKRAPKAPLAHHFRADLDDITSSRKKRLDWLTCWGKQKIQVYGEACAEVSRKQREEKHALGCAEGIGEQEMVGQLQGLQFTMRGCATRFDC